MKKLTALLIVLAYSQSVMALDVAKIRLQIKGAVQDNRYFLCIPDQGCFSIKAGSNGKVFEFLRAIDMNTIFIADASHGLELTPQGLPSSCNVTVKPHQTITISGTLQDKKDGHVFVNQLHCSVQ